MRYFKHLSWWTICGLFRVGFAGAVAGVVLGALMGVISGGLSDILIGALGGAVLSGFSGAICGAMALLVLSVGRPPLLGASNDRLGIALETVSGFVMLGTPILSVGLGIVGAVVLGVWPQLASSGDVREVVRWIFFGQFFLIALPVLLGAMSAARALKHFESAARALPQSRL